MATIYLVLLPFLGLFLWVQWKNFRQRYPKYSDADRRMVLWVAALAVISTIAWARIGYYGPFIVMITYAFAVFGDALVYLSFVHVYHAVNLHEVWRLKLPTFGKFIFVVPANPEFSFYIISNREPLAAKLKAGMHGTAMEKDPGVGHSLKVHFRNGDDDNGLTSLRLNMKRLRIRFFEMNKPPWFAFLGK